MRLSRKYSVSIFLFLIMSAFAPTIFAGDEWREITAVERQMKTPTVEADADAEAIFWEVRVDDSTENLVMKHYVRVKIFTERGREKYSKVDIPFVKGVKIKEIMARVIKADGSIVELGKSDIFEREIVKSDKIKVKAKSFAVPNIEPGVIVEYRYQEVYPSSSANNMRMTFQHDIPIQKITYYFKPYDNAQILYFNMDSKFIKDKSGFYRATMENVPAIKEESQMPPEDEVRSWLVLHYTDRLKGGSMDFWSRAAGYIASTWEIKDTLKPSKDLKTAVQQITAGATTPDEQMAKIYEFCKTKIKNITFDTQMTDEQKDEIKPSKSTTDTYKKMQGTSSDINELLASLATAAGLEARLAFGGDRSQKFFNPNQSHVSFVHFTGVAVKINGDWKYYDPGNLFAPAGMLPWNEESTSVLLIGTKDFITTETTGSSHDQSNAKRKGKFKLLEDGTLEGTVRAEYTGHLGYTHKMDNYKEAAARREEMLKESIKSRISTAEVSAISVENVSDPQKPVVFQYKIRVPNYAQKTGKRLFVQPGFFEYGAAPMFATATRKYDIFFHHPWSETDELEIELPKDFMLDNAETPAPVADGNGISSLKVKIGIDKTANVLTYRREFYFGGAGKTLFPVESYQPLKRLFDSFHKTDSHTITLKQATK